MEISSEDKTLAVLAHLSAFFAPFIVPLVLFFVKKDAPFVRSQAKQALVFHVACLLAGFGAFIVGLLFGLVTHGIGLLVVPLLFVVLGIGSAVMTILAAVQAYNGADYRYPLVGSLADNF